MSLVIFVTAFGPAYCKAEDITYISSPFSKRGNPSARAIGLASGHTLYALDNEFNRNRLNALGLLPPVADIKAAMAHCKPDEVGVKAEPKPKRTRKAKPTE